MFQHLLFIGLSGLLGFTFYEDLRYRGVSWWVFPITLILATSLSVSETGSWNFREWSLSFILLTSLILATGSAYFLLKSRRMTDDLGLGDVLFFVVIIPLFSTYHYVLFLSASFIGSLVIHLAINIIKPQKTIPLAGYQALMLSIYLTISTVLPGFPTDFSI